MRKKRVLKQEEHADLVENFKKQKPEIHSRLDYSMFFGSMFKTFGYTLLAFMALLFILFLVMWLMG